MVFRRFNRNNALRPVNRIKHVIDQQLAILDGVQQAFNLINTTDTPVLANVADVETGSTVNGIYLNVEATAVTAAALPNIYMVIYKNVGGNLTDPVPNTIGANDNKRFVIHQEMKMLEQQVNGNPRTIFNGVVAIPKGYRRNAPNDQLRLVFLTPGIDAFICFQCHYKEFR